MRVKSILLVLLGEAIKTMITPKSWPNLFRPDAVQRRYCSIRTKLRYTRPWRACALGEAFRVKHYHGYEDYIAHQRTKLPQMMDITKRHNTMKVGLTQRLLGLPFMKSGMVALCLGARSGGEVEAFLNLGCFAVGIDVNTGPDNPFVVYGDFHGIQFPDGVVDIVYTNSLDHALDIKQVISETQRVLKSGGYVVLELYGIKDWAPGFWESFVWGKTDDIVGLFEDTGFRVIRRCQFDGRKEQVCFQKAMEAE